MTTDRGHQVAAYDDAAALVARVAHVVERSLGEHVPVVMISRPAHVHQVEDLLGARGVDVDRAKRDGTLTVLDAGETLRLFMVDGRPDPDLFAHLVASVVPADGTPVTAFGEMVALLWERGEVLAALELESLWNAAITEHPIRLVCAYPAHVLAGAGLGDVSRMCELHDHVSLAGAHPGAGETPTVSDACAVSAVHLPVPQAIASVRGFVREALTTWHLDHLVGDAVLITSELATNAVIHGRSPFRTSLAQGDSVVRLAIEDGSMTWPERHHASPSDQDGRGMAIVAALSERSGYASRPGGKVAWAELSR